jgi:hypothetical protein
MLLASYMAYGMIQMLIHMLLASYMIHMLLASYMAYGMIQMLIHMLLASYMIHMLLASYMIHMLLASYMIHMLLASYMAYGMIQTGGDVAARGGSVKGGGEGGGRRMRKVGGWGCRGREEEEDACRVPCGYSRVALGLIDGYARAVQGHAPAVHARKANRQTHATGRQEAPPHHPHAVAAPRLLSGLARGCCGLLWLLFLLLLFLLLCFLLQLLLLLCLICAALVSAALEVASLFLHLVACPAAVVGQLRCLMGVLLAEVARVLLAQVSRLSLALLPLVLSACPQQSAEAGAERGRRGEAEAV